MPFSVQFVRPPSIDTECGTLSPATNGVTLWRLCPMEAGVVHTYSAVLVQRAHCAGEQHVAFGVTLPELPLHTIEALPLTSSTTETVGSNRPIKDAMAISIEPRGVTDCYELESSTSSSSLSTPSLNCVNREFAVTVTNTGSTTMRDVVVGFIVTESDHGSAVGRKKVMLDIGERVARGSSATRTVHVRMHAKRPFEVKALFSSAVACCDKAELCNVALVPSANAMPSATFSSKDSKKQQQ